jgi:hypothetical protein
VSFLATVNPAPPGSSSNDHFTFSLYLCETLTSNLGPSTDPSRHRDLVVLISLLLVINLVPDNDPRKPLLLFFGRRFPPMCNGDILDPSNKGHVIYVTLFIDVAAVYAERVRKRH